MSKWEVSVYDHERQKYAYKGIIECDNLLEAEKIMKEFYPQKNQRYSYRIATSHKKEKY